jgi:uncharacterized protein
MIMDAHAHVGDRRGIWGHKRHAADDHIRLMDECGIAKSVIFSPSSGLHSSEDFVEANTSVRQAVAQYPARLVGFCMVNPMHGDAAVHEVRRCHDHLGFRGIKLHPPLHGNYFVDSPFVYGVAEVAIQLDIPIIFHTDFNSLGCSPYQVCRLAKRYPGAKLIMGHMGVDPWIVGEMPGIVEEFPNVYLETSGSADSPRAVVANPVARLGAHRLLFGSDAPGADPRLAILKVRLAGLSASDEAAVLGGNIARLLKLSPAEVS